MAQSCGATQPGADRFSYPFLIFISIILQHFKNPPAKPPYLDFLKSQNVSDAEIATNGNYVMAWYYTKASVFVPKENFPLPGKITAHEPVHRDWFSSDRFINFDYFLCTNHPTTGGLSILTTPI